MQLRWINFQKFQNLLPQLQERKISEEDSKKIQLLKMLDDADTVGDIDWGAFTMDELDEAFDYIDEIEEEYNKVDRMVRAIRSFEKTIINTDVF
jgi:hypothetical protein